MGTASRSMAGAVVALAAIAAVVGFTVDPVGDEPAEHRRDAEEPATIGARGWQTDPSTGRTTGQSAPASGLSRDDAEVLGRRAERTVVADPGAEPSVPPPGDGDGVVDAPPEVAVGLAATDPPAAPADPPVVAADPPVVAADPPVVATDPPVAAADPDGPVVLEEPLPGPEGAPQPSIDVGQRGAEALALIAYDWQRRLPSWSISFAPAEGGLRGLTFSAERRIEVYVREGDGAWDIARIAAHELGHAVDLAHNSTGERRSWREQRALDDDTPWWPVSGASDFATGAGDFAECFATWQVGSTSLSRVAGACSTADLELVAALS